MEFTDPNAAINYVRQQRGLAPLPNPHVIDGFGGPMDAPTPSVLPPTKADPYGLDMTSEEEPPRPASPLIPSKAEPEPTLPKLAVQDSMAVFDGKVVSLEAKDVNAITKIILLAVERSVRAQLRAIRGQIPKRVKPEPIKRRKRRGEAP